MRRIVVVFMTVVLFLICLVFIYDKIKFIKLVKNGSYEIEGDKVTLVNGRSEIFLKNSSKKKVISLNKYHKSPSKDLFVLLSDSQTDKKTSYYLSVFLSKNSYKNLTGSIFLINEADFDFNNIKFRNNNSYSEILLYKDDRIRKGWKLKTVDNKIWLEPIIMNPS